MNASRPNNLCYLDQIRMTEGAEPCRRALNATLKRDTGRAVTLLNDRRLTFPCLYLLREPITRHRVQRYLNPRNQTALRLTEQILGPKPAPADSPAPNRKAARPALRWMLETGAAEEIAEDDYEEILDVAVSLLLNRYGDGEVLPLAVELLFRRNRRDSHIHDLVWALFRFHDPQVLRLIAQRLPSSNPKDAELAAELLNLDQAGLPPACGSEDYLRWLEENQPYLYFTEESFQYASRPVFCTVDLERKYLQKGGTSYEKQPISPSDDMERACMAGFRRLDTSAQKTLSSYSQTLCGRSTSAWNAWLHTPVEAQVAAAKAGLEGER